MYCKRNPAAYRFGRRRGRRARIVDRRNACLRRIRNCSPARNYLSGQAPWKTTLLDILAALVLRALLASNISTAAVFRSVDVARPTPLIDEIDRFLKLLMS